MIAAVLFAIALIFDLAGISLQVLTSGVFVTAGLLCLALYLGGVGSRSYRRRRR